MSDKKPDFDSLDLSNLQKEKEKVAVTEEVQTQAKTEETKQEAKPLESKRSLNAWIDGKQIEKVTPEEMVEWVQRLCGIEVSEKEMATPRKRVNTIDKVLHIHRALSYLNIGHENKDRKAYTQ